jgi:hypothetical protein
MMRLRKKHSKKRIGKPPPADAGSLLRTQSARRAIIAAVGSVIVVNLLWLWLATQTGKFFPWIGLVQGIVVGLAVQRAGRGLDWRFPAIAAVVAALGNFSGGFLVALSTTEVELQASAMRILTGLTIMTWQTYFDEVISPVDYIYAFSAAAVAAFYAKRRLQRHEEFALRTRQKSAQAQEP